MDEKERRDLAQSNRGEVDEDYAATLTPKKLPQMVSFRLEGDLIARLREVANDRGVTLSDLFRDCARMIVEQGEQRALAVERVTYSGSAYGKTFQGVFQTDANRNSFARLTHSV